MTNRKSANSDADNRFPVVFESLSIPEFRWLSVSNLAYFFGMMSQVALRIILAWDLTQSAMALSYISLAVGIPMFVLAPFGGVIADRIERRRLIILGQLVILINSLIVFVLLASDQLEFWHLILTTILIGAVFPVTSPARHAIVANIVPRDKLNNAFSLSAASLNLAKVLGPASVGLLIPWIGMVWTFGLSVLVYILGLVTLLGISPCQTRAIKNRTIVEDMAAGLNYLQSHVTLRHVFLLGFIPACIGLPFQSLMIIFADEVWQVGITGFGFLQAAAGLGAVLGTMMVAHQGAQSKTSRTLFISLLLFGVLLLAFAFSPDFWLALLLALAAMACANVFSTKNTVTVQLLTSDEMRGRMSSITFMTIALTPLGTVPMAALADWLGAPMAVGLFGALLVVLALIAFAVSASLRNLDRVL